VHYILRSCGSDRGELSLSRFPFPVTKALVKLKYLYKPCVLPTRWPLSRRKPLQGSAAGPDAPAISQPRQPWPPSVRFRSIALPFYRDARPAIASALA